jgi:magnesium transporter
MLLAKSSRRRSRRQSSEVHGGGARVPLWGLSWSPAAGFTKLSSLDQVRPAYEVPGGLVWVDLEEADRATLLSAADTFGLHPLVTEDILERNQRAKVELTGDHLHMVMFALQHGEGITSHELDLVLGQRFLLTAHDAGLDLRAAPFMQRDGAHLDQGPDYILWAIADWLVDGYFPVFDKLGDEIDDLEEQVMRVQNREIVERLFDVRRDLLAIRHAVNPQREIFNQLTNRDLPLVRPERIVYFRDVYDHLVRLTDELDSYRELVSTTLDVYLSQVNNNLSEIMKRLTGVTVILATIGAIAGVFGMSEAGLAFNFHEAAGFWLVTLASILIAAAVGLYFRRRGWI